jgi:hypothetical protein
LEGVYLGEDLEQGEEGEDLVLGDLEKGEASSVPAAAAAMEREREVGREK